MEALTTRDLDGRRSILEKSEDDLCKRSASFGKVGQQRGRTAQQGGCGAGSACQSEMRAGDWLLLWLFSRRCPTLANWLVSSLTDCRRPMTAWPMRRDDPRPSLLSAGRPSRPVLRPAPLCGPAATRWRWMPHPKFRFSGNFLPAASPRAFFSFENPFPVLVLAQDCRLDSGTMAASFGLPDDEIDRLLSEAEARLSGNGHDNGSLDVVTKASPAQAAAGVAAPAAPTAGGQTAVPETKSEKLSVRVPQPAQKKQVRAQCSASPCRPHSPLSVMKVNPNRMTPARSRYGIRAGTTMISFKVIVTLRHAPACTLCSRCLPAQPAR